MLTKKIDDQTYEVTLYDWDTRCDDYVAGHVMRDSSDEDCDRYFWRFYATEEIAPMTAGDLKNMSDFIIGLNRDLN